MTEDEDSTEDVLREYQQIQETRRRQAEELMVLVRAYAGTSDAAKDAAVVVETVLGWLSGHMGSEERGYLRLMVTQANAWRVRRVRLVTMLRAVPAALKAFGHEHAPAAFVALIAGWLVKEAGLVDVVDIGSLEGKLARITETRARGKATAEQTLAEIIYEIDATEPILGITVNSEVDAAEEIERIRKLLVRDVAQAK